MNKKVRVKIFERIRCEEETSTYGKFVVEPLEKTLGITLGNSLRRILLHFIPGIAFTSLRIDGVLHEFSVIKGVVEDIMDIIMNLRGVIIKAEDDKVTFPAILRLSGEGPKKLTAGDILVPPAFSIINKEHHILELAPDGKINMELEIDMNRGYVPAERNQREEDSTSTSSNKIYLDAFFSPIRKVAYKVEPTRVGRKIAYERLIIEIFTNGAISPTEALKKAAQILIDQLSIFIDFKERLIKEEEEEELLTKEEDRLRSVLKMKLEELELSGRSSNALRSINIVYLGELVLKTEEELLELRNFGKKSLEEIQAKLAIYGLRLNMQEIRNLCEEAIKEAKEEALTQAEEQEKPEEQEELEKVPEDSQLDEEEIIE